MVPGEHRVDVSSSPAPLTGDPHLHLGMHAGHLLERAYSITSSPLEDEVEFFFELVPEGELTPRLHKLQTGETLLMRKVAKGRFTLDGASGHKQHYLVATVTGVAPYVSMARTAAREANQGKQPDGRIVVLPSASRSWEFAYLQELQALAERHAWFEYIPTVSRPWEDEHWTGEVGRAETWFESTATRWGSMPQPPRLICVVIPR